MERQVSEGSLHKWFKGSKSKDGKGGWVNVVTGGTCASDEPGEGTPKCVSSAKRASMTKAERLSAARRKKKADPGQQQKSGAAKPTYVSTDSPRKKKKKKMNEGWSDKYKQSIDCDNPKGFSQKAHCQGKKKMKETYERSLVPLSEKAKKCWPGYEKKGTKKMFGKTYNNCVKKEEVEQEVNENAAALKLAGMGVKKAIPALMTGIGAAGTMLQSRKKPEKSDGYQTYPGGFGGMTGTNKGRPPRKNNTGGSSGSGVYDATPSGKHSSPRDIEVSGPGQGKPKIGKVKTYKVDPKTLKNNPTGKVKKEHYDWRSTLDEKCWAGYEKKGMKTMFGKRYPNCVKKSKKKK